MQQSDDAGEGGARVGGAEDGAACRKILPDQQAAGAGTSGRGCCLSISDECNLMRTGRFESRDTGNFKLPIAFPGRSQMIRNV